MNPIERKAPFDGAFFLILKMPVEAVSEYIQQTDTMVSSGYPLKHCRMPFIICCAIR